MINKKEYTEKIINYEIESKICDKCKKTYDDTFDMQEFHHIRFSGGYGSKFGDESEVEADICKIDGKTNKEWKEESKNDTQYIFKPLTEEQKNKLKKIRKNMFKS